MLKFVLAITLFGCGEKPLEEPNPSLPNSKPADVPPDPLVAVLKARINTSTKFESDIETAYKLLNTKNEFTNFSSQLKDWYSAYLGAKQAVFNWSSSADNPPISIVSFLIASRMIANASLVANSYVCQKSIVSNAIDIIKKPPKYILFRKFLNACTVMQLSANCAEFALQYDMFTILFRHYSEPGRGDEILDFIHNIPIREYQSCATEEQRNEYSGLHKEAFEIFTDALDPLGEDDNDLCLSGTILKIRERFNRAIKPELYKLNCTSAGTHGSQIEPHSP